MVELRWVKRLVPAPECGPNTAKKVQVLQSRYKTISHSTTGIIGLESATWTEWADVPVVEEPRDEY